MACPTFYVDLGMMKRGYIIVLVLVTKMVIRMAMVLEITLLVQKLI